MGREKDEQGTMNLLEGSGALHTVSKHRERPSIIVVAYPGGPRPPPVEVRC